MPLEAHVYEELANICEARALFAGDTISHETANECVRRGWATRNDCGDFIATEAGVSALQRWVDERQDDA